jgi:hypothetical protein
MAVSRYVSLSDDFTFISHYFETRISSHPFLDSFPSDFDDPKIICYSMTHCLFQPVAFPFRSLGCILWGCRPRIIPFFVFSWIHSSKSSLPYCLQTGRKRAGFRQLFLSISFSCTLPCHFYLWPGYRDFVTKSRISLSQSRFLCLHRRLVLKKAGLALPGASGGCFAHGRKKGMTVRKDRIVNGS